MGAAIEALDRVAGDEWSRQIHLYLEAGHQPREFPREPPASADSLQ
jgi:hypothetical protein